MLHQVAYGFTDPRADEVRCVTQEDGAARGWALTGVQVCMVLLVCYLPQWLQLGIDLDTQETPVSLAFGGQDLTYYPNCLHPCPKKELAVGKLRHPQ